MSLAGLVSAAPAYACKFGEDPNILCSSEQQFASDLAAEGVVPPESPRALADLGWIICGDLHSGTPHDVEVQKVSVINKLDWGGAQQVVDMAKRDLCPT